MRTTVPLFTTPGFAATVPSSTLVTKSTAMPSASVAVMSHGPLIGEPDKVSTAWPIWFNTIRHPAWAVAEVPSLVGKLPTMTHPVRNTANAVVSPTPPGQAPGSAAESS
jgi:hypothetical protein